MTKARWPIPSWSSEQGRAAHAVYSLAPADVQALLVCATETRDEVDLQRYAAALAEAV